MLSELSLRPPLWLDCAPKDIKNFLGRRYTTQNRTINVVGRCLTNVISEKVVSLRILEMLCPHFFWVAEMGCCGYRIPRLESQWLLPTVATGQEGVWCERMGEFEAWTIFVLAPYVVRGGAGLIACMSTLAATTKNDQKTWIAFSWKRLERASLCRWHRYLLKSMFLRCSVTSCRSSQKSKCRSTNGQHIGPIRSRWWSLGGYCHKKHQKWRHLLGFQVSRRVWSLRIGWIGCVRMVWQLWNCCFSIVLIALDWMVVLTLRRPGVEGSYGEKKYISVNLVSSTNCWKSKRFGHIIRLFLHLVKRFVVWGCVGIMTFEAPDVLSKT